MIVKKLTLSIFILPAVLAISGCDTFKKINIVPQKNDNKVENVAKEAVLPTDRQDIVPPVSAVYTSAELSRGVVKGDWAIERVNGKNAVGETAPFLKFDPSSRMVYGNNGCNVINANYVYNPADSTISFSNFMSTMKDCADSAITDSDINMALSNVARYEWRLDGDNFFMTLKDKENRPLMEMLHQNFQFLNGTWKVTAIDGEPVTGTLIKLVIDVDEGKVHGHTGCNVLNGKLETDMDAANSISFQAISVTSEPCSDPNYETRLIMALEQAAKASQLKDNRADLIDNHGTVVLTMQRTQDK